MRTAPRMTSRVADTGVRPPRTRGLRGRAQRRSVPLSDPPCRDHRHVAAPAARVSALPGLTGANRRWWTLAGACMGLFVLMLDSTVINLALTPIAHDTGATVAGLQWVVNAYLLVLAATVITAGRLGDILGRRRIFLVGMALFAAGSAVCALSNSEDVLVAGRVLQGLGGAALLGLSLAIVSSVFPAGEKAKALGIWAGVSALA